MALNFPNSPVDGQIYYDTVSGAKYVWVAASSKWKSMQYAATVVAFGYHTANSAYDTCNAAFAMANAAYNVQNVDFTLSNSAFAHANASYDSANSNWAVQNSIYTLSNTSYASINSNWVVTNALYSVANSAFDSANNVGPQIAPTYNTANAAFNTANAAYNHSNAGYTTANAAYTFANTRFSSSGGTISGAVEITADLTVHGNTRFIDQQTLQVGDPLIYLAANNYSSDVVDIGFIANYVNTSSANVHTGLYRSSGTKEYYLFQEYNKEPLNNYIDPAGNNFTLAVLNTDIITSNLRLGGVNTINWISSSYAEANVANARTNAIANGTITINNISLSGNINPGTVNIVTQTLTDSANISWDVATAAVATVTLGGNRHVDLPTNLKVGTLILNIIQDSTGGRTLTWDTNFKWPAGVPPVLTSTANRKDIFSFICDGTYLYGSFLPDVR